MEETGRDFKDTKKHRTRRHKKMDALSIKNNNVTWAHFEAVNQSTQTAFENMCRLLFNRYFFDRKALFHSNPNNPGVEIEPIIEPKGGKRISFQAKYFTKVNYQKIKRSVENTIKYYSGQLDIYYFYCNKNLKTTCVSYKNFVALLSDANIEFKPINNETILDQVLYDPIISSTFFGHHQLTIEWFNERLT